LNRPPDGEDNLAAPEAQHHRRTLSDRGRQLLRRSGSIATGQRWSGGQYRPIAETSPSPTRQPNRPQINTSVGAGHGGTTGAEEGGYSPLEDAGAFQAAIGFSGMGFEGETSPPIATPGSSEQSYQPFSPDPYQTPVDHPGYFDPAGYDDTAPLTDSHNLQPISGAPPAEVPASHDRSSFQSVRFLTPEPSPQFRPDDAAYAEAAMGAQRLSVGRKRSLSPGDVSPLHRAGTIVRNMSQRVVNISSDSDIAERTMRRKSSLRHARLNEPPSFLPEYLTDGPASPIAPVEKPPSPIHPKHRTAPRQRPQNPLRGRSLGIFAADNKLRLKLCDLLVHPVTEPLLLVLIIIQTVLLAVDASENVFEHPRATTWGASWIDKALLGLFIIYTAEVIVRVIVSGFIINPVEYSTINRQVGLKEAVLHKSRQLFGPQRQPSLRHGTGSSMDATQPSVLRAFTTGPNMAADGMGDPRQQQRIRLAHRAYLRHSFNRTDFLAVLSFWAAFFMGIFGVESKRHIFIFRMLMCLRIIRLLNLTSGTSVRSNTLIDSYSD
jgi:hypothetical protein